MESQLLRVGFKRALASSYNPAKRRVILQRTYATSQEPLGPIRAAPPINFSTTSDDPFAQPRAELLPSDRSRSTNRTFNSNRNEPDYDHLLRRVRIVPASPSYFTATPRYTDDLLHLSTLYRRYQLLPKLPRSEAPRATWKDLQAYKTEVGEPVRDKGYTILIGILKRLNLIHPSLLPVEVQRAMARFRRNIRPNIDQRPPPSVDQFGRSRAVGRRKSSHAVVFLVEGDGECRVNGRYLTEYFGRLHDRESAVWALKATQRLDKYNVWAIARGGGTTGQAEAITLGLARALLVHEPDLKPALRRAGVVTRDVRVVERKKAGRVKARKMPTWVKR